MSSSSSSCGCAAPASSSSGVMPEAGFSAIAAEYVAIGAAIGTNCEMCLRFHVGEAIKVGITKADIDKAVAMALKVKATPNANIVKLAAQLTQGDGVPQGSSSSCGC